MRKGLVVVSPLLSLVTLLPVAAQAQMTRHEVTGFGGFVFADRILGDNTGVTGGDYRYALDDHWGIGVTGGVLFDITRTNGDTLGFRSTPDIFPELPHARAVACTTTVEECLGSDGSGLRLDVFETEMTISFATANLDYQFRAGDLPLVPYLGVGGGVVVTSPGDPITVTTFCRRTPCGGHAEGETFQQSQGGGPTFTDFLFMWKAGIRYEFTRFFGVQLDGRHMIWGIKETPANGVEATQVLNTIQINGGLSFRF